MTDLSRRQFAALTVGGVAAPLLARPVGARAPLTPAGLLARIKAALGGEWMPTTVDGIKSGDAATTVTGIVTTAMATMAVLQQAVKLGANLVVSCEPTFYARSDSRTPPASSEPQDPVYAAKNALVDKHGLVILRLNEHWKRRQPNPFTTGFGASLGWANRQAAGDPSRYELPATSLKALAGAIAKSLGSRGGIRVIGDPSTSVKTAALLPGSTPIGTMLDTLPGVDLVVAGEVREWESVEYARDAVFAGERKGLVLVGRVVSEEGAMRECATWLSGLVPDVKVRHVPVGDPYWRPA